MTAVAQSGTLSPPGTQLLIHERRLETVDGRRKWVIVAEEIGPGHPRYLEPEAAREKMARLQAELAKASGKAQAAN